MATSVGHSLVGMSICLLLSAGFLPLRLKGLLFCIIIACLPDIDFLPGIFVGDLSYSHHKGTHSFFFAFIVSVVVWALARGRNRPKWGVLTFIVLMSHLAVDYISIDHLHPFGMPLFWPFSGKYFYCKYAFLPEVLREDTFISIFNRHNVRTVFVELIIFLPIALLCYKIGVISSRKRSGATAC